MMIEFFKRLYAGFANMGAKSAEKSTIVRPLYDNIDMDEVILDKELDMTIVARYYGNHVELIMSPWYKDNTAGNYGYFAYKSKGELAIQFRTTTKFKISSKICEHSAFGKLVAFGM